MKKMHMLLILGFVVCLFGCGRANQEQVGIQIGDIAITLSEFEDAFSVSPQVTRGMEGRKEFLENYILKKLMLREAEKRGLDKDEKFLKEIQRFWERSLLKSVLTEQTQKLAGSVHVQDREISEYFKKHKVETYTGKELAQVYPEIKWLLLREKQSKAVADWIDSLRVKEPVKINYKVLGIEK